MKTEHRAGGLDSLHNPQSHPPRQSPSPGFRTSPLFFRDLSAHQVSSIILFVFANPKITYQKGRAKLGLGTRGSKGTVLGYFLPQHRKGSYGPGKSGPHNETDPVPTCELGLNQLPCVGDQYVTRLAH